MKKNNFTKEQIDQVMSFMNEAITDSRKRRAGVAIADFYVSSLTGKFTNKFDDKAESILVLAAEKLRKLGYYSISVKYEDDTPGHFRVYIAKEVFYIEMVHALLDLQERMSPVAYIGFMGKLAGYSDLEIKHQLEDAGCFDSDEDDEEDD